MDMQPQETMFDANSRVTWRESGIDIPEGMVEVDKVLEHAGLDWEARMQPQIVRRSDGSYEEVPNSFYCMRSDLDGAGAVLGDGFRKIYEPIQNRDMFSFCDALVAMADARYVSVGLLNNGRRVWALAELPDAQVDLKGSVLDPTNLYLLVYNSFDGGAQFTAAITGVRMRCHNVANYALKQAQRMWRIRHTPNAPNRMGAAAHALDLVGEYQDEFGEQMQHLLNASLEEAEFERLLGNLWPVNKDGELSSRSENQRGMVRDAYTDATTCNLEGMAGTRYAALNAVSLYADYGRGTRDTSANDGTTAEENRLRSIFWGGSQQLKQRAFDLLLEDEIPSAA